MDETLTQPKEAEKNINFENANLSGAKMSGFNFSYVNLNGAVLSDCNLSHANFSNAQLISANLRNANLCYADLTNANLKNADLRGAQLDFAKLTGANFEYALLINASLNQSSTQSSSTQKPYDQLRKMAFYDGMTGVYNRQAFEEFFEKELLDSPRYEHGSALFIVDLDHFKAVNDKHGHLVGDALLKDVAVRLQKLIRQGDLISRFGGDEFALYFKSIRNEADSGYIAQKIIDSISKPYTLNKTIMAIGASIGIYYWKPDNQLKAHDILSRADIALYSAKSNGRNCYQYYSQKEY